MTAWLAVVAPMCVAAKCCVDFLVLEYGDRFRLVTDEQFLFWGVLFCFYALTVDFVNFVKGITR